VIDPRAAAKRDAAVRAVDAVQPGMVVGLGTGSTAAFAIEEIGRRLAAGLLRDIVGIPTSNASHRLALECGVPLSTLERHPEVDVTIDGADEIDPELRLIKGGGGAHTREKLVARASRELIVVADAGKRVARLGEHMLLPVEILPFGGRWTLAHLGTMGLDPRVRAGFVTDNGNLIADCALGAVDDLGALACALKALPGVVETGLFVGRADVVVVARESGVDELLRRS